MTPDDFSIASWAASEFGDAELDARNVARLVQMAAAVARHPHPKVAEVFPGAADLQGAYDWLENPRNDPQAVLNAAVRATARKAADFDYVLLPTDGVALSMRDLKGKRGLGGVGSRAKGARGLNVMDAIALTPDGVPLGLAGLSAWNRSLTKLTSKSATRPLEQRETNQWILLRERARETFNELAPNTRLVWLHDRGADAWPVLLELVAFPVKDEITVVRAAQNRRTFRSNESEPSKLLTELRRAPRRWRVRATIPAGHGRRERHCRLEYRAAHVTLRLRCTQSSRREEWVTVWVLQVHEMGRVPRGEERLDWILLTNQPLRTLKAAREVVRWYELRWRIEDQHKTWKGSGSDIEQVQLRSESAIRRWMILHAAVGARALSLTHMVRDPEIAAQPAEKAFAPEELVALRAMRTDLNQETPPSLTVGQVIVMIACLGGYMPAKNRPPGPKILRRALERLQPAIQVVRALGLAEKPEKKRRK